MEIIIVGNGQFGSALSNHFSNHGHQVHTVSQSSPWPSDLSKNHVVLLCVPTQKFPLLLAQRATNLNKTPVILSAAKGLIKEKQLSPLVYISRALKRKTGLAVLSGPSFASEISQGLPAALVVASKSKIISKKLCKELSSPQLRFYVNTDPVGVELCGALKNVYALLAGMCEGLRMGESARSSLNTRALAEMSRVVKSLGGQSMTVFGLAGVGDLFLTGSSEKSRNFRFGKFWAEGMAANEILAQIGTVEGYWTTNVAYALCKQKKIRAPLIEIAHALLDGQISSFDAFEKLMIRETRGEFE